MIDLKEGLRAIIEGEVIDDPASLAAYSRDASIFEIKPRLVVVPKNTGDLSRLINFVSRHVDQGISLTPRAAGTDMSGGPLSESIIVDMARYFDHIGPVTDTAGTVQPGAYYRDFEKVTLHRQRLMPAYPASREICTVGGMVANNAGGEKSLTYGKVEDYVQELKVMLRDGNEYRFEPLTVKELERKIDLPNLEGRIYRQVFNLLNKHYDIIQAARPAVSKDSTGYHLWNVWNKKTFDLTRLFSGSQGTLGIISEITFKLIKPKKASQLVVIELDNVVNLAEIVNRVLVFRPESFECYDDHTLKLALRFLPHIANRLKIKNVWTLVQEFMPEFKLLFLRRLPKLVLIAEFLGDQPAEVRRQAQVAADSLADFRLPVRLTEKKLDSKKYWVIRRESFALLRQHSHINHTAPFIDDIVVVPAKLPQFLPELDKVMKKYNLLYTLAGHIGDGNFHIIPLMNMADPKTRRIIPELSKKVFALVFRYGGSMSGEHNDGLIRTPYLKDMYSPELMRLFAEVKHIFDPEHIFNPGKKIGTDLHQAMSHIMEKN